MKIHSYSTSPPHEEVNTRTANSGSNNRRSSGSSGSTINNRKAQHQRQQQPNGVGSAERRKLQNQQHQQQQQQQQQRQQSRPLRTTRNNNAQAASVSTATVSSKHYRAELDSKANLRTRALRRTQQQPLLTREHKEEDDADDEPLLDEEATAEGGGGVVVEGGPATGDPEDDDDECAPSATKRSRRDQPEKKVIVAAATTTTTGTTAEQKLPQHIVSRRIKQEVVTDQPAEPLEFIHLVTGNRQHLQDEEEQHHDQEEEVVEGAGGAEAEEEDEEEEEEEEDDGTSSSTASAEEEIGEEMEPQQQQQQQQLHKAGLRTTTIGSRVQLAGTRVARAAATTTILMTEEEYEQHQQQQQLQLQHDQQHADDEDVAMDEYEGTTMVVGSAPGGGGSEDMEDTDGALTGNRLFRKKVKRKVHAGGGGVRTANAGNIITTAATTTTMMTTGSTGTGGGSLGAIGGTTNSIASSKGKLQMLQEFPTLFIGLRRNRMFLVNSLAQSFDLNQRDIVLTLRKIKQNESSARLANFFGIGAAEVDLLFHTSVPKIADCLRNFIVWPDDFTMKLNVPVSLRQHFNRIHLILNYLVLRVKQNAVQQLPPDEVGLAYCPVDQCHKLKYLVASTLDGCVCFVSRAFGVQTDDEQLLAQSGFLTKFKTNTNLIAGQNFHNFEDRLANGHDHRNNNGGGGRNRRSTRNNDADDDSDLERVLGNCNDEDNFEDIVSEKISKSRTFKLKNYIENILENFQNHQMLSPHSCIDGRTFKLLDDIVVIVGALINLQKQEID